MRVVIVLGFVSSSVYVSEFASAVSDLDQYLICILYALLMELFLSTSKPQARKYSTRVSWDSFCRLMELWPENAGINVSGKHVIDSWS